jgi:hypothetical protein
MVTLFSRPFPRELVRDLLGITRALYRAAESDTDRARLEEIGSMYLRALDMGAKFAPDTLGRRAAIDWAERATEALGEFVATTEADLVPPLRATLRAIGARRPGPGA